MYKKRYWALLALLAFFGLLALLLATPAQAADFRGGDRFDVGGHIFRSLVRVGEVGCIFGRQLVEVALHVLAHGRIGVLV